MRGGSREFATQCAEVITLLLYAFVEQCPALTASAQARDTPGVPPLYHTKINRSRTLASHEVPIVQRMCHPLAIILTHFVVTHVKSRK